MEQLNHGNNGNFTKYANRIKCELWNWSCRDPMELGAWTLSPPCLQGLVRRTITFKLLNGQIEKTLSRCREAHFIVHTYDQIVKHLKVRLLLRGKGDIWKEYGTLARQVQYRAWQDPPTHRGMPGLSTRGRLLMFMTSSSHD